MLHLFSTKQKIQLDQEVKISICFSEESDTEILLKAIRAEKNVLSIQNLRLDHWYSIHTRLPVESANSFAVYLKDKYHLKESYYDKPVDTKKHFDLSVG